MNRRAAIGFSALATQFVLSAAFAARPGFFLHSAAYAAWALAMGATWLTAVAVFAKDPSRRRVAVALALTVLARVAWVTADPVLSEDVYRYQWDGRMLRHGLNPYSNPPADPRLAPWRDDDYLRLRHGEVKTVYPPLAQALFALAGSVSDSPRSFKAEAAIFDLLTAAALAAWLRRRKMPIGRVILWAACPIVLMEFAGHGHGDAAGVFCLALFALALDGAPQDRARTSAASLALTAGAMVKFYPLVFVPRLFFASADRRAALVPPIGLAISYLPFVGAGADLYAGLVRYADVWAFNGSVFDLLTAATGSTLAAKALIAAAFGVIALFVAQPRVDLASAGVVLGLAWILGTPTAHPWYLVWALVFAPIRPAWALLWLGATMPLAHLASVSFQTGGAFALPFLIRVLQFGPVPVLIAAEWLVGRRRARLRT